MFCDYAICLFLNEMIKNFTLSALRSWRICPEVLIDLVEGVIDVLSSNYFKLSFYSRSAAIRRNAYIASPSSDTQI